MRALHKEQRPIGTHMYSQATSQQSPSPERRGPSPPEHVQKHARCSDFPVPWTQRLRTHCMYVHGPTASRRPGRSGVLPVLGAQRAVLAARLDACRAHALHAPPRPVAVLKRTLRVVHARQSDAAPVRWAATHGPTREATKTSRKSQTPGGKLGGETHTEPVPSVLVLLPPRALRDGSGDRSRGASLHGNGRVSWNKPWPSAFGSTLR